MNVQAIHSERGQVLVLIILSLVGLLGFAALAIDGGMIYSERRVAQNAADAAAYAGAASLSQEIKNFSPGQLNCTQFNDTTNGWNTNATKKPQIALRASARAADNTFTIAYKPDPTSVTANDNAVWMECDFDSALAVNFIDVHVRITKAVSTSLMHIFYNGPAVNTVDSVVRVYAPAGVATGAVIVALCSNGSGLHDGITFGGSTNVTIDKGKVISNCKLDFNGASGTYTVPEGMSYFTTVVDEDKANLVSPTTVTQAPQTPFPYSFNDTLKNRCDTTYAGQPVNDISISGNGKNSTIETYGPGKYNDIKVSSGSLILTPGLYCIYGSVSINSSNALITYNSNNYVFFAKDVTIYMPRTPVSADDFTINGGSTSYMTAPSDDCFKTGQPCAVASNGPPVRGLLMWYAPSNLDSVNNRVTLNGDGNSVFEGSLFAPNALVKLVGASGTKTEFGLQIVADDVDASGGTEIEIYYDSTKLFSTETQMGLQR